MYFPHSSETLVTIRRVAEGRCTVNCHYTNYAIFCNANTKITPAQEFLLYFSTLKNFRAYFSLCEFSDITFLSPCTECFGTVYLPWYCPRRIGQPLPQLHIWRSKWSYSLQRICMWCDVLQRKQNTRELWNEGTTFRKAIGYLSWNYF
jgi:hypothetical protein